MLAEVADDRANARVEEADRLDHEVRGDAGRHLAGVLAEAILQDLADVGHPHEPVGRDVAASARRRLLHRADVQVGDVADVDEAEPEPRYGRHPAAEQPFDQLQREGDVVAEGRADDGARIDDRQPLLGAGLADQAPGLPLGDRLRARVGRQARIVAVRPVPIAVGRAVDRRAAAAHGGDRGRHHDPLDPGVEGRPQNPQGAVPGRDDQLVGILRLGGGNGEAVCST